MVAVTLMWATAGVVTRHLQRAQDFEVTFWRSFFTLISLLVILPMWRGRAAFSALRRGGRLLWISGICWSIMFTAFMVALMLTSVANVLVTMALGPLFTALAARFFIGHALPARTWFAIVLAGSGIGWMYGSQLGDGMLLGTLVAIVRTAGRGLQLDGGAARACKGAGDRSGARGARRRRHFRTRDAALGLAVPGERARPWLARRSSAFSSWRYPACLRCCARAS